MKTILIFSTFIFVSLLLVLPGCVGNDNPVGVNNNDGLSISIASPAASDTIAYSGTAVSYNITQKVGILHIQVFVNGKMTEDIIPSDNTLPVIKLKFDSSMVGSRISYYLAYYDKSGGWVISDTIDNVYVDISHDPPFTPYNFRLMPLGTTSVNLSWKDSSSGETGYEIFRKSEGEDYPSLPYLAASPGNFNINDETIIPGEVYYYKIRGVNKHGKSAFSAEINTLGSGGSASVPPPTQVQAVPVSSKSIKLTWKDNSSNENFFGIERRYSFGEFQTIDLIPRNASEYIDTKGLSSGIQYYYRIKAYTGSDSSWSSEVSVTTPPYDLRPPVITSITNPASRKVIIKWKDNDPQGYFILYRKAPGQQDFISIQELPSYQLEYEDETVVPGKTYYYKMVSTDGTFSSDFSPEVSISTLISPVEAPVINLAYYGGKDKIILSWTLIQDVDKFIIERKEVSASPAVVHTFEVSGGLRTFTDRIEACGKVFEYKIRAFNEFAASPYSEVTTVDGGCW